MLNTQKIYIINKKKFIKKNDHSDYWYQIEYIYLDTKGEIQYNYEFVSAEDYDALVVCFPKEILQDLPSYLFKGHYQNYKFKADILVN